MHLFRTRLARLGLLAGLCSLPVALHADLPHQEQLPANSLMMVAIPDTAQWWGKVKGLPVTQGLEQFLASPQVTSDLDYQQFQLEKQKLAQKLGFPATLDELLGNVIGDVLIYAAPGAPGTEPEGALVARAKDKTKAARLLATFDEINKERTAPAETTATLGQSATKFEKLKIGTVDVSQLTHEGATEGPKTLLYGLSGDLLVLASSRARFEQAIAKGDGGQGLEANADFKRLSGKLPWGKADAVGYVDANGLVEAGSTKAALLSKSLPGMTQSNRVAFTVDVNAGGVEMNTASTANPATLTPNIKPRPLQGLPLLSSQAMVGIAYGLLDVTQVLQELNQLMNMTGAAQQGASPYAAFEQATGISVQNDIVPATGQEVVFAVNNLQANPMNPMIPIVDLVLGVEVKDEAKMRDILGKLEKLLESRVQAPMAMQATPGAQPTPAPPAFTDKTMAGVQARSLDIGIYGLSPSYAITKGFAVISLTAPALEAALTREAGQQPSIATATGYTQVASSHADSIYSFSVVDVNRVVQGIVVPMLPFLAGQNPQQAATVNGLVTQVLGHFGTASAAERIDGDLSLGHVVLGMQ